VSRFVPTSLAPVPWRRPRLRVRTAVVAAAVLASAVVSIGVRPVEAASPAELTGRVDIGGAVKVPVPLDMAREQRALGERVEMLTLADGGDVLTVVVYRAADGAGVPDVAEALAVHAEELARVLVGGEGRSVKRRLMGKERSAIAIVQAVGGVEREAWVVAAPAKGLTIVVTALGVKGAPTAAVMLAIADGIRAP